MLKLTSFMLPTIFSFSALAIDISKEEVRVLSEVMRGPRERITSTLESDAHLRKSFERYADAASHIINDKTLTISEKKQAVKRLNLKQKPQLEALLKSAKIDQSIIKKMLASTFQKFKAKYGRTYSWSMGEGLSLHWRSEASSSSETIPAEAITQILSAPFDDRDTSAIGNSDDVELDEGGIEVLSNGVMLTSTSSESGIGHFFRDRETHNRVKVTASISNAQTSLLAISVLGVTTAGAKSYLRIKMSGRTVCEKEYDLGSTLAIMAWVSDQEFNDQFSINCTLSTRASGEELNTTLTAKAETLTAGGGASLASTRLTVRQLEIKHFNR